MSSKYSKQNKINVVTLGCSKNVYDSEVLMGQLKANNKNVVHEDVNDDGMPDLLFHFATSQTGISCETDEATLIGMTIDGKALEGTDSILPFGCNP